MKEKICGGFYNIQNGKLLKVKEIDNKMVERKTWKEFRDNGLLWFVNTILHLFGYAICCETIDDEIINVYPARVKFRGFSEKAASEGYIKVTKYIQENVDSLLQEAEE